MSEEQIGKISHYFGHIHVADIEITDGALAVGANIHIKGHSTDLSEEDKSSESDQEKVVSAKKC